MGSEHLDDDTLLAFVQGQVTELEATAVNDHIDSCAECRRVLAETARYYLDASLGGSDGQLQPRRSTSAEPPRYVVLGVLGVGASGVVYAAFDSKLDRKVALKLLRVGTVEPGADGAAARLLQEAQTLARLAHPNVVAVHDVGTLDDRVFIAMEFVEGITLSRWLAMRPRPWREVVATFKDLSRGLAAAHAAGIVHRDFKPDNVLIGDDGRPRIVDFGLAAMLADAPAATGTLVGTPAYMAPEQLRGEASGTAADQFSLCAALYEALYRESPFDGTTLAARTAAVTAGRIRPSPKPSSVPSWLRSRVVRGLGATPASRYPSMAALIQALDDHPMRARRRAAGIAAGIVAVALGGFAYRTTARSREAVCTGAAREIADVWHARRAAVSAAFSASARPFAGDQLRAVDQMLDDYTSRWAVMRTEACEATRVRGEQSDELLDLRMGCLDVRLQQVGALTNAFSHADSTVVENAVRAVHALPSISGCADATALRAPVAPPTELVRTRVNAMRDRLVQLHVERDTGRYRGLLARIAVAVAEAHDLHYRPIEADALVLEALVQADTGDAKAAEQGFLSALVAAEVGHQQDVAIAALTGLTFVVGYGQVRYAEGEAWSQQALAMIEGAGNDAVLHGTVLDDRGSLRFREGKYAESIADHRSALALLEQSLGPDDLAIANVLNNLGAPLEAQGKYAAALLQFERALRIYEAKLGPNHPDVAMALNNVAATQRDLGNYQAAADMLERVVANKERLYGPETPAVAATLANLGNALHDLGKFDRAMTVLERAIAIYDHVTGKDSIDAAPAMSSIANVLLDLGRPREAVDRHQHVLAIKQAKLGPNHPSVIETMIDLAEARRIAAQPAAALADYQHVLAITEDKPALERYLAYELTGIGDCELDLGAPAKATTPLARALELRHAQANDPELGRTRFALARALAQTGSDGEQARALANAARTGYADDRPASRSARARIDAWLAGR